MKKIAGALREHSIGRNTGIAKDCVSKRDTNAGRCMENRNSGVVNE